MKLVDVRGLRLPIFVFLTFACLSVFQPLAYAQPGCREILSDRESKGFIVLKSEVEPKRTYVRGQEFKIVIVTHNLKNLVGGGTEAKSKNGTQFSSGAGSKQKNKPENELRSLRQILRENNPDLVAVQEVESKAAGDMLMDAPDLAGKYHFFLIEGNDPRGIDVGIFVKKSLPFKYKYISHKDLQWTDRWSQGGREQEATMPLFSRDFPVLSLYSEDATEASRPVFAMGVVHSKSKRDRKDRNGQVIDFESTRWRKAQYVGIRKIMDGYQKRFGEKFPYVIAGDFNAEVQHSDDIEPIRPVTKSAFDIEEGQKDDPEDRGTHAYFPKDGRPEFDQIDDVRVAGTGIRVIEAQVLDYIDGNGKKIEWPSSYKEREKQGSDHKAVRVDVILKEN